MEERRQHGRNVELLEIKEINRQPGDGSFVLNLSPAGAKLETSLVLAPGEVVEFSYQRPGENQGTRHWGQVVWVLPVPDKPGRFYLGVEFLRNQD